MKKVKHDLTGQKFGRLTVIGIDDKSSRKTYFICKCDCGNVKSVRSDSLIAGAIRSCGCLKKEQDKKNLATNTHELSHTRLYDIWQGMKSRCCNEHDPRYQRYGERGIEVCEEWKKDFANFYNWAIANGYADNLSIDRIDNDGNYCAENCRWVDNKTQCRNRSTNITIKIGNSVRTLMEWCEIFQVDYKKIHARYERNGFQGINDLFN